MKLLSTFLLLAMIVAGCGGSQIDCELPVAWPPRVAEPVAQPKPAPAVIEATDPSVKSKPAPADRGPGG